MWNLGGLGWTINTSMASPILKSEEAKSLGKESAVNKSMTFCRRATAYNRYDRFFWLQF